MPANLANKMGTVVEDIVAPNVRRLAREVFDCGDLQSFITRGSFTRSDDRSRTREFDALYVGSRAMLLNETKSSPRAGDARAFTEFLRSGEFALYFPEYKDLPIVPAIAVPSGRAKHSARQRCHSAAPTDCKTKKIAKKLRAPLDAIFGAHSGAPGRATAPPTVRKSLGLRGGGSGPLNGLPGAVSPSSTTRKNRLFSIPWYTYEYE